MRDLYKAGGKRYFDEIAVHPFTNNSQSAEGTTDQMQEIVTRVRAATRKAHDGRVPIIITELSWPASVGKIPKKALLGLETTPKGQTARLKAGYKRLVKVAPPAGREAGLLVHLGVPVRHQGGRLGDVVPLRGAHSRSQRRLLADADPQDVHKPRPEVRGLRARASTHDAAIARDEWRSPAPAGRQWRRMHEMSLTDRTLAAIGAAELPLERARAAAARAPAGPRRPAGAGRRRRRRGGRRMG